MRYEGGFWWLNVCCHIKTVAFVVLHAAKRHEESLWGDNASGILGQTLE
jgi:hypothetical protein